MASREDIKKGMAWMIHDNYGKMPLAMQADKILEYLNSKGVVKSSNRDPAECESCPVAVVCGYVAFEPLV